MILKPLHTTLADGTPIVIREVTPADADLLRLGFEHLSPTSRRFRFFGAIKMLSPEQIDAFTSPSDRDNVAIGAAVTLEDGLDPAGTARYVRETRDPRSAEFALTVVDRHQHHGLGSLLLGVLASIARHNGIERLVGLVMRGNRPMLALMKELGARREAGPDESLYRVVIDIRNDPQDYPATPAGDAFRRADALARTGLGDD